MNILLVATPMLDHVGGNLQPVAMDAVRECPPLGIYLLVGALADEAHDVKLVDLVAERTNRLDAHLDALAVADLVGVGATSMSWPTARDVIGQVRAARPDVPVVLGGVHPTLFDAFVLGTTGADYVVRGEAESALRVLCRVLEGDGQLGEVPNLSWRTADGGIARSPVGPKIAAEALACHPLPAYDRLPMGVYKSLAVESSRGCGFDCSFCSTPYRRSWRGVPPEAFVDRLESLLPFLDRTRLRTVHVVDDEFSMNRRRATSIARLLDRRRLRARLIYDSRADDLLEPGFVEAIAPHTYQFLVGAECGYDEGLRRIGKRTTTAMLIEAAGVLARYGLAGRAEFSFILGLPWESVAEVERTLDFAAALAEQSGVRVLLNWYCQVPGSRLWDEDRRAQVVHESLYDDYGFMTDLYLFRSGVKLRPSEVWHIVDRVAASRARLHQANGSHLIEFATPPPKDPRRHPLTEGLSPLAIVEVERGRLCLRLRP
ncbi:MAG: B12-binding domain-containing radical SAM protein [Actinobacteria bacterium]|nr:MAG: B12-binding domain-containing radical SAM protein [Actinomycetota bacterium]